MRRAAGRGSPVHTVGPVSRDTNRMTVTTDGRPATLTALEYRLLAYLVLNRDRVVPATELLEHLYGDEDAKDVNAVEAVLARLRRKLGQAIIETRRGFGYVVKEPAPRAFSRSAFAWHSRARRRSPLP